MTGEITVFSGSAHPEFAEEMCQILGVELAPAPYDAVQQRLFAGAATGQLPAA